MSEPTDSPDVTEPAAALFHPAPPGLERAGLDLWFAIAERYQLRPDELAVLEDACRTSDTIAALQTAWEGFGRPMTAKGSMGQKVIDPLIGELRQQRAARAALLARLKLPELDEGAGVAPAANQQRAAATSRWASAHRGA